MNQKSEFILSSFRINFLHDGEVEVFESEEGRYENRAKTNGQDDAHEAAVDHSVDAVAWITKTAKVLTFVSIWFSEVYHI